ncbi:MAG: GDP-mannose 4,6-dehydratase [Gammaproteobacteria bacterium]|nr:GDP-mannose 4,6-dehydratase [Gammaproteobacteria bacterium]
MQQFKKVFITGGAGFIGSHMAHHLLDNFQGQVTVYDNFCSGFKNYLEPHLNNPRLQIVTGDMLDFASLKSASVGHDFIFHFAANPDIAKSMTQTDLDLKQTVLATFNLLESMRLNGIKQIAYASGSGVYGDVGLTETAESFGPLMPISMYGASKLGAEGIISAFCHMFDMQAWIYRFANVVGKRQTHGVGFEFMKKLRKNPQILDILGNGTQSKSYIHVSDILHAMFFVIGKTQNKVNIFNVATDDYLTVNEIAKIVIQKMGLKDVKYNYAGGDRGWKGDVPIVRFNLDKIHQLGWQAKYSSEMAINLAVSEMLTEPPR